MHTPVATRSNGATADVGDTRSKSALAAEMRTSRAAIHRLLDPENTSVTLATLNRAARSLGQKIKIELVAA